MGSELLVLGAEKPDFVSVKSELGLKRPNLGKVIFGVCEVRFRV